jgi:hypothetical protein
MILTTRLEEQVAQSQKFSSLRGALRILLLSSIPAGGSELQFVSKKKRAPSRK